MEISIALSTEKPEQIHITGYRDGGSMALISTTRGQLCWIPYKMYMDERFKGKIFKPNIDGNMSTLTFVGEEDLETFSETINNALAKLDISHAHTVKQKETFTRELASLLADYKNYYPRA